MPDAYVFAATAVVVVAAIALILGGRASGNRQGLRRRFLGAHPIHHADDLHHHRWVCRGQLASRGAAANTLQVHLGWAVQVYNAAEALPNLINPFWMIPLLGLLRLKAREVVGFTIVQFLVHVPLVLVLLWALGLTLHYHPPVMP